MNTATIAVLGGDGIGPDVVTETLKCLSAVEHRAGKRIFTFEEIAVGAGEYLRSGTPLPDAASDRIKAADAILLGAMGLPDVRRPDGTEMTPQIELRERLDLYCGLRPVKLYRRPGFAAAYLRRRTVDRSAADPRELRGFVLLPSSRSPTPPPMKCGTPCASRAHRRKGCFMLRSSTPANAARKVTLVDKANVLPSMAFFRRIFDETAARYPDVATERVYVDAAALYLVQHPERFDVLVTENMFGDILSDLLAGLIGGMGMAPSADIGERHAVFQPSHGTAPDIAGKGIANPVATILSAAMMLDWLSMPEPASWIRQAVESIFVNRKVRTRDMGGTCSTTEMGDLVSAGIRGGAGVMQVTASLTESD